MNLIDQYNLRFKNVWYYSPYFVSNGHIINRWTTLYRGIEYTVYDKNPVLVFYNKSLLSLTFKINTFLWAIGGLRRIKVDAKDIQVHKS